MSNALALIRRLKTYILQESEEQRIKLEEQWSRALETRLASGWAIAGLRVEQVQGDDIRMRCTENNSRFREGDLLVLHRGDPTALDALHVELQFDGDTEVELSLIRGNSAALLHEREGWIADQDWFDSSPFFLEALDDVLDSERGRRELLPLLQGERLPVLNHQRYEQALRRLDSTPLNESQREAVAEAYASDPLYLIQGPPGTGKTLVLAYLARLLVQDGMRVMVTALTHRAINNALNKIAEVDATLPAFKIGAERTAEDVKVPCYQGFHALPPGQIEHGYVIGATPFSLRTRRLQGVEFDVIIFDEASQITLPLALMAMLAGERYVFIGDEHQLPPVTLLSHPEDVPESVYAFFAGRGNATMLDVTYRLNDVLVEWPNQHFYEGQLRPSDEAAGRRLRLRSTGTRWDEVLDPNLPLVFLDLGTRNSTVRNLREADVAVGLIYALIRRGVSPEEIGVVVPFRAQSRRIRSLIRQGDGGVELLRSLVVDTVERMQGQEREVVLVSFTASHPAFLNRVASFLLQPPRLNVAVTRPRTKLILLGSANLLNPAHYPAMAVRYVHLLQSLANRCRHFSLADGYLP